MADIPHMDKLYELNRRKWANTEIEMNVLTDEQQSYYDRLMEDNSFDINTQPEWKEILVAADLAKVKE